MLIKPIGHIRKEKFKKSTTTKSSLQNGIFQARRKCAEFKDICTQFSQQSHVNAPNANNS